jgi:hypothetical protein
MGISSSERFFRSKIGEKYCTPICFWRGVPVVLALFHIRDAVNGKTVKKGAHYRPFRALGNNICPVKNYWKN